MRMLSARELLQAPGVAAVIDREETPVLQVKISLPTVVAKIMMIVSLVHAHTTIEVAFGVLDCC